MRDNRVTRLEDCSEFRQTLLSRPPALAHGVVFLLFALLGTAILWAWLTKANLVVRAAGYVRPMTSPQQVFLDFHGDTSSGTAVAISAVRFRQGDVVQQGDVLLQLDTRRLDSEIGKRELTI